VLYSVQACKDEYRAKFPNLDVEDRFAKLEMFRRESRRAGLKLVKILLKI
jgi:hypothetical protein